MSEKYDKLCLTTLYSPEPPYRIQKALCFYTNACTQNDETAILRHV